MMNNQSKSRLLRDSTISSVGQIISIIFLFIGTIILTRVVNPEDLGKFYFLMSIWFVLEMITSLGFEQSIIKYTSGNENVKNNYYHNIFFSLRLLTILISIAAFIFVIKLFNVLSNYLVKYIIYITIIFVLLSLRNFSNSYIQSLKKFKKLTIILISTPLLKVILYIIFYYSKKPLTIELLLQIEIFSLIAAFLIQKFLLKELNIKIRISLPPTNELKAILKFSFHLYLNGILSVISNRITSLIIPSFIGYANLAYFEVSKKVPDGFGRLTSSLTMVYFPYATELANTNNLTGLTNLLNKYISNFILITLPFIFFVYLFKENITILFFSKIYITISNALFILLVAYIIGFINSILGYTLVAVGKSLYSFKVNFMRTIIYIVLLIIFLYLFNNFEGVIISILITNIIGIVISIFFVKKIKVKLNLYRLTIPILFLMSSILLSYIINFNTVLKILLFLIFDLVYLILFKNYYSFKGLLKVAKRV